MQCISPNRWCETTLLFYFFFSCPSELLTYTEEIIICQNLENVSDHFDLCWRGTFLHPEQLQYSVFWPSSEFCEHLKPSELMSWRTEARFQYFDSTFLPFRHLLLSRSMWLCAVGCNFFHHLPQSESREHNRVVEISTPLAFIAKHAIACRQ